MTTSSQPNAKPRLSMVILLVAVFALGSHQLASAQTFQVLYNFTGGRDGTGPLDGVTLDRAGNLYGTASAGGNQVSGCGNSWGQTGCGAVFELAHSASTWIMKPLYDFQGGTDYGNPGEGVIFGPDGALYGTSSATVFRLQPPPTFCASVNCSWQETLLHHFTGQPDASGPDSRLVFDTAGNMYGVTFFGGAENEGAASYTYSVLHTFNSNDGEFPVGTLTIDSSGSLYGTTVKGGMFGYGVIWEITP